MAEHQAPSVLTILALSLSPFLHECEHACGATFGCGQASWESVPGLIQEWSRPEIPSLTSGYRDRSESEARP